MGRRPTVEDWRRAVYRSGVSDRAKVLLLFMADHMRSNRHVSIPRAKMAAELNVRERRVTERITEAHRAGFLSTVSAGYIGHTAIYQGLFPDAESGRDARPLSGSKSGSSTSPLSSAETRPLSERKRGRTGRPPITTADLSLRGYDRNCGSYEEQEPSTAASRLTDCDWHPHTRCPADCANLPVARQETA